MTRASQASVPNVQTYMYSTTIFIYNVIPLNFGLLIFRDLPLRVKSKEL